MEGGDKALVHCGAVEACLTVIDLTIEGKSQQRVDPDEQ